MQYLKYNSKGFFATNSTAQKPIWSFKYICEIIVCMYDVLREYKKGFYKSHWKLIAVFGDTMEINERFRFKLLLSSFLK